MNDFRKKICMRAYNVLDVNGDGQLDITDIKSKYNAKMHPDVKQGKKTEEEVLLEFMETFETHHNIYESQESDHVISKEEWIEYYNHVSMSIDTDEYFQLMMANAWGFEGNTTYNNKKTGWAESDSSNNKGGSLQASFKKKVESPKKGVNVASSSTIKEKPSSSKAGSSLALNLEGKSNDNDDNDNDDKNKSPEDKLLGKFRERLFSRGGRGIIGLAKQFKIFDDNRSGTLELAEFQKAMKDFRVDMTNTEIKQVFNQFDIDGGGEIDYNEFLRSVRGEMNKFRKGIVKKAFDMLDTDKSGVIEIVEAKAIYSAKKHPDVLSGRKTEDEIIGEFLETFETHHNLRGGKNDKRITLEEFTEYYNNISASIDNDEYFELMMTNAWKLGGSKAAGTNAGRQASAKPETSKTAPFGTSDEKTNYSTSNKSNASTKKVSPGDILGAFRAKLASRGTRGLTAMRRSFMVIDDDNSKTISPSEFSKICNDYRLDFSEEDVKKLFTIFDTNKDGSMDYDEFVRGVVGDMNDTRKALVKKAFNILDKNKNGVVEIDDLRGVYNAKNHPKVKDGSKTEDEILAEFLDNLEYHFNILVLP